MTTFFLTVLAVFAFAGQAFSEVTLTPSHKIVAKGNDLKIFCNPGELSHGDPVLTLEAEGNGPVTVKTDGLLSKTEGRGFTIVDIIQNPVGGTLKNITVTVKPEKVGTFTVKCGKLDPQTLTVISATCKVGVKDVEATFDIPKTALGEMQADKLYIKVINPERVSHDLNKEAKKECTGASDSSIQQVCYKFTLPDAIKETGAGVYKFEVMHQGKDNKDTIVTQTTAVRTSLDIKIEDCKSAAGSNCIADMEHCVFRCHITGYPYSDCALANADSMKERMTVECAKDQSIKITFKKPTQDDSGEYNITAKGGDSNALAHAKLDIRVKDKLAPLWPFLGICAEVIILCAIILFFEKRHQKKLLQQEQEDAGASEPMVKSTGKGGGEVRQRAAKA